jgi:hypothetical protein
MAEHEAILAELEQLRQAAAARIRAKLESVVGQIREQSSRAAGDLGGVIPSDLEALLPIAAISERVKELAKPAAPTGVSLEVMRRLDAGRAQSEVLQELLRQIGPWCGPRAIVVLREGYAQGWASGGFPGTDPARGWRGALADSPALAQAAEGKAVIVRPSSDSVLSGWFDGSERRLLVVPMSLRGKVVGMLLALEGESGLDTAVIQQLTYTVGLMLETLSGRTVVPTAALREPEDRMGEAAVPIAEKDSAAELFELEEEAPTPARAAPPEVTPPVADASATVHLKVPVAPAPAAPPVAPPPPAAPPRVPDEERKHDEARRFARLLVSEIRLYNEQAVAAGKISRDIYQRLKDDIDRSREMYDQRVPADVRANSNYFHDELVRILADGEADALGM